MDKIIKKKKWTFKKVAAIIIIGFITIFILYSFIFGDHSSKLNVDVNKITVSVVQKGPFREFIPVIGNVIPITTIYLDAVDGGKVDKIYLEAGSMVKKGNEILRLVNTNQQLSVMYQEAQQFQQINSLRTSRLSLEQNKLALKSQLAEIEYQYLKQKAYYERSEALKKKGMLSQQEFEQIKWDYELLDKRRELTIENIKQDSIFRDVQIKQLEVSVNQMQANLDLLKSALEASMLVRAPISGQLTSLNAEVGQLKGSGSRLGQIDVLDSSKVRASIDEHYISRITTGLTGEFDLSGLVYKLYIEKVYPEVTEGKFEVDMLFKDKAPQGIRRGQTLHIRLNLGDLSEAILLSNGGFFQKTGGNWVYVTDNSGSYAIKRQIRIGRQNSEYFEVLQGLEPGEKVITSSYDNFGDIDKLILK